MRKVRLDLDGLAVESFATTGGRGVERGTVQGRDSALTGEETIGCSMNDCTDGTQPLDTSRSLDGMCHCMPGVVPSKDAC